MILSRIQNELKKAQLSKDGIVVSTLRLLLSEIHNAQIQKGSDLEDTEIVSVIQRELKKRAEATAAFRSGGREEMAAKEEAEAEILKGHLPPQLTDEELQKLIDEAITEVGAVGISDIGKVIGVVMGKVKGQAEGGRVSLMVKGKLAG